jgi:hypothetical protein
MLHIGQEGTIQVKPSSAGSGSSSGSSSGAPPQPYILELYRLWGNLVGHANRHNMQMAIDTPVSFWRPLSGLHLRLQDTEVTLPGLPSRLRAVLALKPRTSTLEELRGLAAEAVEGLPAPGAACAARVVTFYTRAAFVRLCTAAAVQRGHAAEFQRAWYRGLSAVLPAEIFPLWSPAKLSILMTGKPELSWATLKAMIVKVVDEDGHHRSLPHPQTYQWLLEVLEEASDEQRLVFFEFIIGQKRVPRFTIDFSIGGLKNGGVYMDTIMRSHTCFRLLQMGKFASKESLRRYVTDTIKYAKGFAFA